VRSRVRVSDKPHVKPLADLLDSYGGYGVILLDKQGARLFHFHLGELVQQEGFLGEEVRHAKRGGGTQTGGKRVGAAGTRGGVAGFTDYEEQVTERNMKDLTAFAAKFFADHHVRRVVVCGSDDNVSQFRSQLPKAWQSLVIGSCILSMNAGENEVLERILQVGVRVEEERERQLVESIVTSANKGKAGVLGLQDTLGALREGRIQTLVIRDGYRAPAYCCQSCGYMSAQPVGRCPFCNGETEQIPDAVETIVRKVMQSSGDVDVLHDGQDIKGFDKIGALLRY
jgi:peptide subunit release factor 1 (eRF1)